MFVEPFTDHARVVRCPASHNHNAVEVQQFLRRYLEFGKQHPAFRGDAASQSVADCLRLLVYLLQHKVRVAALFGGLDIPCHLEYVALEGFACQRC